MTLHDPTLFRYIFVSQKNAIDGREERTQKWDIIWDMIHQAWRWVHDRSSISPPSLDRHHPSFEDKRQRSYRLAGTSWLHSGSPGEPTSCIMESRALHDSTYLQIGLMREGDSAIDELKQMKDQIASLNVFEGSGREQVWLGDMLCLYYEVPAGSEEQVIADAIFKKNVHNPNDHYYQFRFSWGLILLPSEKIQFNQPLNPGERPDQNIDIIVVAYRDLSHQQAASWFLNFVLPRVGLFCLKMELAFKIYEMFIPRMDEAERELALLLKGNIKRASLIDHERHIIKVSQSLDQLIENVGIIRHRIIHIQTNLRNLQLILQDRILEDRSQNISQLLSEDYELGIEQIKVDLEYFQTRNEEAQLSLQTLQSLVDVERAKNERIQVIVLGIFGMVLSANEVFADVISPLKRIIIVAMGVIVGFAAYIYYNKKE
ncbi:hypothetical protein JW948_16755 [bacterium]|nr:hypothetical protein [bacterium]